MATLADGRSSLGYSPKNYRADQGFFLGVSITLSLLILVGFGQLALRGITDPVGAPVRVHVHALLLLGWLGVFCSQNLLAWRGNIVLHRTVGWAAVLLVAAIVVANYYVTIMAIAEGRAGPAATPAGFLALGTADTLTFAGLVAWAIFKRRDTQWHRRLMFGATLMLAAAGINRLVGGLPPSTAAPLSIGCQLAFVAAIAWHDRRALRHVHKATIAIGLMVLVQRSLPSILPMFPSWVDLANWVMG